MNIKNIERKLDTIDTENRSQPGPKKKYTSFRIMGQFGPLSA